MSQVKKGEHRRSEIGMYERCELHLCCTAAVVDVPLLYCADAFEIQSVGWNLLLVDMCSRWHAHIIRTHRSAVRACHKTDIVQYGYCYSVAAGVKSLRCDTRHTAAAAAPDNKRALKAEWHLCS